MYGEVNTAQERAAIERQIAILAGRIQGIQGSPKTDNFDPAEHCLLLHKTIARLERLLCPESNAIRNAA
jgi:hypothetical protein